MATKGASVRVEVTLTGVCHCRRQIISSEALVR